MTWVATDGVVVVAVLDEVDVAVLFGAGVEVHAAIPTVVTAIASAILTAFFISVPPLFFGHP
ncbi:hypothetical protein [Lentzea kentuckyensis]|uniref:hypothetical protein n=1 Tax=Lentzea kentuckyensis TaxID=360086 RepID=UPI001179DF8D|nr:hypothetical protein [Lentzea kentuckyensis]